MSYPAPTVPAANFPPGQVGSYPVEIVTAYGNPLGQSEEGYYGGRFIPSIWSGKILEKFYDTTIFAAISNTDYEGEIKNQGDHVIIRTRPTITIKPYKADQTLIAERPASDIVELMIDRGIYWNTVLDDVMDVQSDLNMMSMWAQDAAEQMKITIDRDILDKLYEGIDPTNKGAAAGKHSQNINLGISGAPIDITVGSTVGDTGLSAVMQLLVQMGQCLDEHNIPESGRWAVVSPAVCTRLKLSELRDVSVSGDGTSMVRNGRLGVWNNMEIYVSNLLPRGGTDPASSTPLLVGEEIIYAGSNIGLTFASQLTKVETLRAETTFGTLMRGLNVYGYKTVQPIALVGAIVTTTVALPPLVVSTKKK